MPYPEQSYPLIFFLCKDIFTYAIRRISNGKDYEPLDSYSGCPMSTCQVSSDVVNCVKSLHAQTSVYTIDNTEVVNEVIQLRILSKHVKFIGLDCEWFNQKRKSQSTDTGHYPVALLQLATANECFLIRLSSMSGALPETVKDLLEDRHILKFGVAILEDAKRLQKMGISLRGAVDLRHIVKRCQKSRNIIQDPER